LEGRRSSDLWLRKAFHPLTGFAIIHAIYEWIEMFDQVGAFLQVLTDWSY